MARSGVGRNPVGSARVIGELSFPEPMSGCWIWVGFLDPDGYAAFGRKRAHRVIYEALKAPIPTGLVLDHLCRNRCCVNPDHLEPVTQQVNVIRGKVARRAGKSHCLHGHELTPENRVKRRGYIGCKVCARKHRADWADRNTARQIEANP